MYNQTSHMSYISRDELIEAKRNVRLSKKMNVTDTVESGSTWHKVTRSATVTGIYKHIFTVSVGRLTRAYSYVDLVMGNGIDFAK